MKLLSRPQKYYQNALLIVVVGTLTNISFGTDIDFSKISGDIDNPRRHARLRQPTMLPPDRLQQIYNTVKSALKSGYASTGQTSFVALGRDYQTWQQANTTPYLSATHGNHYLNNYVNDIAIDYLKAEKAGVLPEGSILVKDSFSVTSNLELILGPLFVMEKMQPGFNPVTGDWKYSQIQPEGTFLGETNGLNKQRVEYCIACHLAREDTDHLYFVPPNQRVAR